ncbi:MAG TPA: protein translocase subunit SecF [Jiangellaceae bacterium]
MSDAPEAAQTQAPTRRSLSNRLYTGETSLGIVNRAKRWYAISAVLLVVAVGALIFRGLEFGIEFTGGAEISATASSTDDSTVDDVTEAVVATGIDGAADPRVTIIGDDTVRVQAGSLSTEETNTLRDVLANELGVDSNEVTTQVIGPSWGAEITRQASLGLGLFVVAVAIFLSIAYEWKLAVAALVSLLHDVVITVGIYALVGFDVTPATVIGFLTILGYSLYDTVVIFDKLRENTKGITAQNRHTYAEAANLAVNQSLMRSMNTSIIALLPIGAILFVGAGLLGAGTLKDLSLALFIGVAVGTYSSIFIATPLAADLKRREPAMLALERRVAARRGGTTPAVPVSAATTMPAASSAARGAVVESGSRRQPQKRTRAQRRSS